MNNAPQSIAEATSDPSAQPPAAKNAGVEPASVLVISDLAVLRVLSDSLRLRLLEAFGRTRGAPRSVKEVAKELGQSATKLYYHVNLLEENGLLLVAESRLVSGILEKKYIPAAHQFTIDKELLRTAEGAGSETESVLGQTVETVLHTTAEDFRRAIHAGAASIGDDAPLGRRSVLSKSTLRLRPEDAAKVVELLETLTKREDDDHEDADTYGLTLVFYRQATPEGHDR